MPIQILSPQLTNQIAAGEVVERPASVVKELVENSLDAGADEIHIEIENGGAGLIRIRDNGFGIPKAELGLALSRHATSKISTLEDLEAILSLGFRGEALASISSVSRLTLTSRPPQQAEAWQVFAQGREMETTIQPAAHPVGTTVNVANLFFNTPARRKFLRTEKTEFNHIDEVIRRIALVKPQTAFILSHNGKVVRHYRKATDPQQKIKRLAAICGQDFVNHALQIDWRHNDLHLYGWVADSGLLRPQNDLNYSYVNGRMMRDKTINHAVRLAYGEHIPSESYPAFVLFIDLDPSQVDVNVHPAKHEVRFHQNRLVHDFIHQGVSHALASATELDFGEHTSNPTAGTTRAAAGENIFAAETQNNRNANIEKLRIEKQQIEKQKSAVAEPTAIYTPREQQKAAIPPFELHKTPYTKAHGTAYQALLHNEKPTTETRYNPVVDKPETPHLRLLTLLNAEQLILLQQQQQLYFVSVKALQQAKLQLALTQNEIQTQPLLIPLVIHLSPEQARHWQQQKPHFARCGFEITQYGNAEKSRLTLSAVPALLRRQNLQACLVSLLNQPLDRFEDFLKTLVDSLDLTPMQSLADAANEFATVEQLATDQTEQIKHLLLPLDLQPYLTEENPSE
ncbi:DNA mismatch repair endonuclease MutL [Testudinibacter sp. TR-2022]|uniref:DNA mismatch repair endonuclease MutL n=1 Tax=Testudinibacter sp. TR-2022 TaxID=2585029 RepID=UPI00111B5180|nr:DNA mismatch repair endonuclease MutL [Testudinibacter sp. TR-2022]TNH08719.1 DNA mismatch repair endonuclease MutL [Pasteurellaceae bacterium Phil11]TNH21595.1 DNA mismatch repair endonuclease MutL [Testudinibacter sp. TR-2022]TNH27373.1 DNA mismatch repair endonuclease MutL [Testudinibacter sp. TR-2022]